MSDAPFKPPIFIASSVERLDIAYTLQEHLEYVAEPTVWTQDIFKPSSYALLDLLKASRQCQFAVFVFAPDDVLTVRDVRLRSVRDNVIFEYGLFIGALGLGRCFLVTPRHAEPLHLPSDLLGLTPLTYVADRFDRNLLAALGPTANRLRRAIREELGVTETAHPVGQDTSESRKFFRKMTVQDFTGLWNGTELAKAREEVREMPSNPYGYDDEEVVAHNALRRIFTFLEGVADAILAGGIDEAEAKVVFDRPVRALWPYMHILMAPPNHADDWWEKHPAKLAELHARWSGRDRS